MSIEYAVANVEIRMLDQFTATFIDGTIVPDTPVPIDEGTRLEINVIHGPKPASRSEAFVRFLAHVRANPFHSAVDYVTRDKLYEGR